MAAIAGVSLRRAAISFSLSRRLLSRSPHPALNPLLLGHFFHPRAPYPPHAVLPQKAPPSVPAFQPLAASSPRLSLDFVPVDVSRFSLSDSHLGLLLLHSRSPLPTEYVPRFLVCDPARRLHVMLPPPPCAAESWFVGSALLSRAAHPSGLRFEAVCLTVDADRRRAWVASFDDGQCHWRALPRPRDVVIDLDPCWFERHCVRAAGSLYWYICNSGRVLALDAATLEFSFLPFTADESFNDAYRVGEMQEDGRLCIGSSIRAWVYGHYSYHLDTGKLECLSTDDGMEYGHPILRYFSYPADGGGGSD